MPPVIMAAASVLGLGYSIYSGQQAMSEQQKANNRQYELAQRAQQDQAAYLLSPEYRASQDQMWLNQNVPPGTVDVNAPASGSSMIGYGATDMGFIPGAGELLSPDKQYQNQYLWA